MSDAFFLFSQKDQTNNLSLTESTNVVLELNLNKVKKI